MWKKLILYFGKGQKKKKDIEINQQKAIEITRIKSLAVGDRFVVKHTDPSWNNAVFTITEVHADFFSGYRLSGSADPVLDNFMGIMETPYKINKTLSFQNVDVIKSEALWNRT